MDAFAVPVDARGATVIVDRLFGLRAEFAHFAKLQRVVAQEENRGRVFKQVAVTGAARNADRQTKCA